MEWPGASDLAVYEPTREPAPSESPQDLRMRIGVARVRHGLPVTDELIDTVLAQMQLSGQRQDVFTPAEREEVFGDNERVERARLALKDAGDVLCRIELCWLGTRRGVRVLLTDEPARYEHVLQEALGPDRVVVREVRFTGQQLDEFQQRVEPDALSELGIFLTGCRPEPDGLTIDYFAADQQRAERLLEDRYGAFATFRYQGASRYALSPFPFGSWLADGDVLHVFYALPHNGERTGDCTVAELEDSVIIALTILDWRGAKTLVGGFTPSHATVRLRSPLGNRAVIDSTANRARPHWTEAAAIKLPRPQDL